MLGTSVRDPQGIEGPAGEAPGLGLLDVATELSAEKALCEVSGTDLLTGEAVRGYEMHMGRTTGAGLTRPMLRFDGRTDGCISADRRVFGCYLHGLFAADGFRAAFLSRLCSRETSGLAYDAETDAVLDDLAEHLEHHLDLDGLLAAAAPVPG
jgi:adenosylcobyric acid synthase